MSLSESQALPPTSGPSDERQQSISAPTTQSCAHIDPEEIEAIRNDLASLRIAIDLIRAQYEERMAVIRQAHQSILSELGEDGQQEEEALELTGEVQQMEVKMEILESQAGGLETALDRYTQMFMEEVQGGSQGGDKTKE